MQQGCHDVDCLQLLMETLCDSCDIVDGGRNPGLYMCTFTYVPYLICVL